MKYHEKAGLTMPYAYRVFITHHICQFLQGSYFCHRAGRGGEGLGKKSMGRVGAGNPPFPTVRGGAGKGSKSAGGEGLGRGTY